MVQIEKKLCNYLFQLENSYIVENFRGQAVSIEILPEQTQTDLASTFDKDSFD